MVNHPLVSIIIPSVNRADLIKETIDSVEKQLYQNWECIIVDDGSSEKDIKQIRGYLQEDTRFSFYKRPNEFPKGAAGSRNYGFKLSKGKYIQWLDDDDLLEPDKILKQVDLLEGSIENSIAICSWDYYWPGKRLELIKVNEKKFNNAHEVFAYLRKQQTFFPPHIYLCPRKLIEESGNWDARLTLNDDGEFFTRILINSSQIINSPDTFALYRNQSQKRLSSFENDKIKSLLLSFYLMNQHLLSKGIENKAFFKWKLLKLVLEYWCDRSIREEIIKYSDLFNKTGINLNHMYYYRLKYWLYRIIYPTLKKMKNHK